MYITLRLKINCRRVAAHSCRSKLLIANNTALSAVGRYQICCKITFLMKTHSMKTMFSFIFTVGFEHHSPPYRWTQLLWTWTWGRTHCAPWWTGRARPHPLHQMAAGKEKSSIQDLRQKFQLVMETFSTDVEIRCVRLSVPTIRETGIWI